MRCGPQLPEMQIRDPHVIDRFQLGARAVRNLGRRQHVEQLSRGVTAQARRPVRDQSRTDHAHEGVHEGPPEGERPASKAVIARMLVRASAMTCGSAARQL